MEDPRKYIGHIDFVVSSSKIKTENVDFIPQDLNEGSVGKYIYAVKVWTNDPNHAITSFAFTHGKAPEGYRRLNQDLNEGAQGRFNYLCVKIGG